MSNNLIDQSLQFSKDQSVPVKVSLRTGENLSLRVKEFDGYVVLAAGEPDYLLYRHSILDVDGGGGAPARKGGERSGRERRAEQRPAPKPKKPQGRAPRKSSAPPKAAPRSKEEESFANPMADQMKKWLDSRKDSE